MRIEDTREMGLRIEVKEDAVGLPVKVENKPSIRLTKLSSVAMETSDKVITFIPGSSNDMATAYPFAWAIPAPLMTPQLMPAPTLLARAQWLWGGTVDGGETLEVR